MIIREMKKEDVSIVSSIESSLYVDKWTKEAFLSDLNNEVAYNYVLTQDDVILGYYGFWVMFDNIDITKVSIRKELQGYGLGNILMEDLLNRVKCFKDVKTVTLEVRVSNSRAINLYKKNGFKQICIREKYYESKEDAYIMQKEVNQEC